MPTDPLLPPAGPESEPLPEFVERIYVLGVRAETLALAAVGTMIVGFAVAVYLFGFGPSEMRKLGYVGLFMAAFVGSAAVVLPFPSLAAAAAGGALLDPVFGLPAPVMVGLVAGVAEGIGELSGYAIGFGGSPMVKNRRLYRMFYGWMRRYGAPAMFLMAIIPNPVFDIAGMAAGAARVPLLKFFVAVLIGKIIKSMYVAGAGALIFRLFFD
ncbi:MAG: DedA family protein [Dehalococcoidia bacterium]|nr:DedA family protein [Dehalococcoidia bacterium]